MSLAAILQALSDAGATNDMLVAAVRAHEAAQAAEEEARLAKKRAGNAERQRRFRIAHPVDSNESNALQGVTERDERDAEPKEKAPQTPKKENQPLSKENPPKGGQKKGFPLPADWLPTAEDWSFSVARLGQQRAETELAKFRDYWPGVPGEKGRKLDWDGTWRNWVRKAAEFAARASPQSRGNELARLAFPELRGQSDDEQHSSEHQSSHGARAAEPPRVGSDRDVPEPGRGNGGGTLLDFRATGSGWS